MAGMAMSDKEQLRQLTQAVMDYLDQLAEDEKLGRRSSWPEELEVLVGWAPE